MRTIKHEKMLLKKSQKLHSNKYGRYFGNSILSYIFKNITETIPSRVCAVVSLKPGRLDWVRDYVFRVKPVYPFPPPSALLPIPETGPSSAALVVSFEPSTRNS